MLTIGSLFSGIGGLELGLERAGLGPVLWQAERVSFCRDVLARHWPDARRYENVEDVGRGAARVGLVCGGFPCQDISPANARGRGLGGEKSGLWREYERVVDEVRPAWCVVENNGHHWRKWVPAVRLALWQLGYASVSLRVLASDVGALHERSRVFVVANADGVLLRQQSRWRLWAGWQAAAQSLRARAPWVAPDVDGEGQPQPQGAQPDEWGWAGDCADPWRGHAGTIEPTLARGVHGVPDRLACERALGNAVVPQVAEVIGGAIVAALTAREAA